MKRHELLVDIKKKLAQPLFDIVDLYFKAHNEFTREWSEKMSEIINTEDPEYKEEKAKIEKQFRSPGILPSFSHSLFGQLAKELTKLVNHYVIFSFYG